MREAREKQVYPYFREFETGGLHTTIGGKPIINFSSNDYLGLTNHPKVKEAAKQGGRQVRVRPLELARAGDDDRARRAREAPREVVRLREVPDVHDRLPGDARHDRRRSPTRTRRSSSTATATPASSTARSSRRASPAARPRSASSTTTRRRASSASSRRASARTRSSSSRASTRSTATRRTSPSSSRSATRYDAVLVVDDAHGTGTLGERGTGILEETGLEGKVPIVVSTFSKTFGGIGGLLLGSDEVVELMQAQRAQLPLQRVAPRAHRRRGVDDPRHARGRRPRAGPRAPPEGGVLPRQAQRRAGFDLGASNTHIMPVMCREERKTLFMHVALLECGVLMVPITYPAVKHGEERLRVNITRGHTQEDMDTALELLKTYGEAFFVLSGEEIGPMED